MINFKKLSFLMMSYLLSLSTFAKAQSEEEFSRWNEAVGTAIEVKADIDDFLRVLGDDGNSSREPIDDSVWLSDAGGRVEGDNVLLRLLQDISRKQVKALEYSQKATEQYWVNYNEAQRYKHKACKISGLAKLEAKKGLMISKVDRSLSNQQDFIFRFETIIKKLARFRDLLQCH